MLETIVDVKQIPGGISFRFSDEFQRSMQEGLMEDLEKEKIEYDGMVDVISGGARQIYKVIGDRVVKPSYGGQPHPIGFVKDGIAYQSVYGGEPKRLGKVSYFKKE